MIKNKSVDPDSGLFLPVRLYNFLAPAGDPDFLVDNADISAAAVSDVLTLAHNWLPMGLSLFLTLTDAAATTLTVSVQIEGYDLQGNPITDTISATGAAPTTMGTKVFRNVSKVTITEISNGAASDKLDLGFSTNNAAMKYGIPHELRKVSSTGKGGERDTLKEVFKNGAVSAAAWAVDPQTNSISGVATSSGSAMVVVLDPTA